MILVLGAGGTVGGELVKRLAAGSTPFRAAYHSPDKAERARAAGRDAVVVDLARPDTLRPALDGVTTLFLLSANSLEQTRREIDAARAAAAAGVSRIVKLSVWGAPDEAFSFARIHRPVERAIEATGVAFTFLRPNGFMQNFANDAGGTIREQGVFYQTGSEAPISHVDARDIAAVATAALTQDGHAGRAYALSGPEAFTGPQAAARMSAMLGRPIACVELPPDRMKSGLLSAGLPEWQADRILDLLSYYGAGRAAAVTGDVKQVTGRDPIPFDQFLVDHRQAFETRKEPS